MRSPFLTLSLLALIATPLAAQTADDIIARYAEQYEQDTGV